MDHSVILYAPASTCEDLERLFRRYWSRSRDESLIRRRSALGRLWTRTLWRYASMPHASSLDEVYYILSVCLVFVL